MKLLTHIHSRLASLGLACSLTDDAIIVERPNRPRPLKITCEPEWEESFVKYRHARSLNFDLDNRILLHNTSLEVLVTRLSQLPQLYAEQYVLKDASGNSVAIGTCSHHFALAFFDSAEYPKFYEARIKRRLVDSPFSSRKAHNLLWFPTTAVYTQKGRKVPPLFRDLALRTIRSSLFKVAVEQHDCMAIWKSRNRRLKSTYLDAISDNDHIPQADYEEDVVSFYKVAKASPFPSQSFLAYYHVLEYYFLRVAELKLHDRLYSMLNATAFKPDKNTLNKLISLVRGQDARGDETEMLRNVLDRFIDEQELIDFINDIENKCGEKIYTKRRRLFGEDIQISPIKDHATANSAKTLKHIRNAIVHSSDRYKREDCHIPLSETEEYIEEYIPLVRFIAERVIYGSASNKI